jgi:hypothetical protein
MKEIKNSHGSTMYLNSGDWIENLTALEYADGKWEIYKYDEAKMKEISINPEEEEPTTTQLYDELVDEFNLMKLQ